MKLDKPDFFPFSESENDTLQVLLKEFVITRIGEGSNLVVNFNHTTPTIRRRESRSVLQSNMQDIFDNFNDRCSEIQEKIDAVLIDRTINEYPHPNESFIFRYCSGGTLPVLTLEGNDYYCLFLRDIKPYGWNIANGSTDTLLELLDPSIAIRRELREELIAVDVCNMVDCTFMWDTEPKKLGTDPILFGSEFAMRPASLHVGQYFGWACWLRPYQGKCSLDARSTKRGCKHSGD